MAWSGLVVEAVKSANVAGDREVFHELLGLRTSGDPTTRKSGLR